MLKKRSINKHAVESIESSESSKKIDFEARVERAKAVSLNKEIAKFARQKDLASAKESFQTALANGGTNSHTFSAIINAHVRCGDIVGAKAMYALLKKTKNVRIDVVSCTTLMKGFGSVGDLDSCDDIMRDMLKANPPIAPNIRTINTYLRGCLWCGGIQSGERMFARMQSEFHITPDISSWEYIVAMMCQALLLDKALPMIGRLKGDPSVSGGVGAMCINLARAAALLGELKICRKALKQATDCLNTDEELQMAEETGGADSEEGSSSEDEASKGGGVKTVARPTLGGKQAWKLEENDARAQSLEIYKEHRRAELRQEIEAITSFISKENSVQADRILSYYDRVFSFDLKPVEARENFQDDAYYDTYNDRTSVVDSILQARVYKFGLAAALARKGTRGGATTPTAELSTYYLLRSAIPVPKPTPQAAADATAYGTDKNKKQRKVKKDKKGGVTVVEEGPRGQVKVTAAVASELDAVRERLEESVDDQGKLRFNKIFATPDLPVKLEICSGGGEWAVKQAIADIGSGNWITAEIRHERVYQTFTRAIFEGASNLAVFGGDANELLTQRIPPQSLHNVFVNYPEPPQQLGGENSQGKHLLTADFFSAVEKVLKTDGICTVVTDNLWYGRLILRTIASMSFSCALSNAVLPLDSQHEVHEELSGFVLHKGKPGVACGHVTDASSYFDRLWKRGRQTDRYFLVLKKNVGSFVAGNGGSAKPITLMAKRSGVGLPRAGGGKKIKFDS